MLLSKQPGDTGVYATATGTRVSVYDLSREDSNVPAGKKGGYKGYHQAHDSAVRGMPSSSPAFPTSVPQHPQQQQQQQRGGGDGNLLPTLPTSSSALDVYTTFHPRWGYPIRPLHVVPLNAQHLRRAGVATTGLSSFPPTARPSLRGSQTQGLASVVYDGAPLQSGVNGQPAAPSAAFVPTSLSLSCATDKVHFFLSGEGGGGGAASSGSGWIGSCDAAHLLPMAISSRLGAGGGSDTNNKGGAAAVASGCATRSPSAYGVPTNSGTSTPYQGSVSIGGSARRRRGTRRARSKQELGSSSIAIASASGLGEDLMLNNEDDERLDDDESVEVSSEDGDNVNQQQQQQQHHGGSSRGPLTRNHSTVNLPPSSSRQSLYNLSSATSPRAAGAALATAGNLLANHELPLAKPKARVLGPVSASGWDPRNAATLALGRQDGVVQLLDVEYLVGGADEAVPGAAQRHSHTTAFRRGHRYLGDESSTYHLTSVHSSTVQERQLTGQVTAMDWVPQSHLTVVAARRQDGLGYYAELLDLRSPESAVRYLGAPPEALGAPFFLSSRPAGSLAGVEDGNEGDDVGGGAPLSLGGVSPFMLCYGEHVACDPSKRYVATVGTQHSKDIVQLWDLRQTARPLFHKVLAKTGYTSLCWSMTEPLTIIGATKSGELRVHSFAAGRVSDGRDRGRGGGDDEDGPPVPSDGMGGGARDMEETARSGKSRGAVGGGAYGQVRQQFGIDEHSEDDGDGEDAATPSGSSFVGTTTTTASSLNGELALAGTDGSGNRAVFSTRMKSRTARKNHLAARVPAAAVAWAHASSLSSTRGPAATMASVDPDVPAIEAGGRTDLPRLVLLNGENGELYYQVYDRRGSTVTLYDGLPLVAAGPNLFVVGLRSGLRVAQEVRDRALLAMVEDCLSTSRAGSCHERGSNGPPPAEPALLRVVRRALAASAGGATGDAEDGGANHGVGHADGGNLTPLPAPQQAANGAGALVSVGSTPPAGPSAGAPGDGTSAAVNAVAKDYTGIDLLDDDDEDEVGGAAGPTRSSGPGVDASPGAVPSASSLHSGSSGPPTASASVGRASPQPPQGGSAGPATADAPHHSAAVTTAEGAFGTNGASSSASLNTQPSTPAAPSQLLLVRGARPADAGVLAYLLDVLPLCASLGLSVRRGLTVSRLASGFATDPERNLLVLEKEGRDREAYALFHYGLVMARHLYGKTPSNPKIGKGGNRKGPNSSLCDEEPATVPITQAVPGILELLIAEHRERERLGLLNTPLPQPHSMDDQQQQQGGGGARQSPGSPVAGGSMPSAAAAFTPSSIGGGWPGVTAVGLPGMLPSRRIGGPLHPLPPSSMATHATAAAAMQPSPRASLGALRELFLHAMGWTDGKAKTKTGATVAPALPSTAATEHGDAKTAAQGGAGRRRHTTIVPPNSQPRKRDPQSFFLDGEGVGLHSLQECIERRVCLLTLMDELSEAAELLALYGAYHPLYPSMALQLSAAAAGKERRKQQGKSGPVEGTTKATAGLPPPQPGRCFPEMASATTQDAASPVWQRTLGCTFWLALALTFVDDVVAVFVASPLAETTKAESQGGGASVEGDWSMSCLGLAEQRRFVMGLLRCFPRLPLPDVIGLATALLLPPRYTANHLNNIVEVMQALVHQQYEYGPVPAASTSLFSSSSSSPSVAGAAVAAVAQQRQRVSGAPASLPGSAKQQQQQQAQEAAHLRELLSLTSRCSLLLAAVVEGIGLETAALQRYVDETADVQTPLCYAAAFGPTQSSTFRAWRDAYRAALNAEGHFMLRSQHDLQCIKTLKARSESYLALAGGGAGRMLLPGGVVGGGGGAGSGGGGGEGLKPPPFPSLGGLGDLAPPPGMVGGALNSMMKRTLGALGGGPPGVTPKVRNKPTSAAPGGAIGAGAVNPLMLGAVISANSNAATTAAAALAYTDPTRSVELRCNCGQAMHATAPTTNTSSSEPAAAAATSHVKKQMVPCGNAECRQWQTPMCTVCGERMESRAMELPPGRSFVWCSVCLHGGHYCHISEWFAKHTKCPVEACPCQCYNAEYLP